MTKIIAKTISDELSKNNNQYVKTALANLRISGSQIRPKSLPGSAVQNNSLPGTAIQDGTLDILKVREFSAEVARIAVAEIDTAVIDVAQINNLEAYVASVTYLTVATADIDWANITNLTAEIANIALANITTARIKYAQIDGLVAGTALITEAVAGKVQIESLSVGDGNIVNLSANKINAGTLAVERLIIRGSDKSIIYAVNNMGDLVSTQVDTIDAYVLTDKTITADKIIAGTITSNELNVVEIFANRIVVEEIIAGIGTFAEIFAESAVMPYIQTNVIESDALRIVVGNQSAEAVEDAMNAIQSENQPDSPVDGMLWIDTSTNPPALKRYNAEDSKFIAIADFNIVDNTLTTYKNEVNAYKDTIDTFLGSYTTDLNTAIGNASDAVLASAETKITESANGVRTEVEEKYLGENGEITRLKTSFNISAEGVEIRHQGDDKHGIDLKNGEVSIVDEQGKQVAIMSGGNSYFPSLGANKISMVTGIDKFNSARFMTTVMPNGEVMEQWIS